MEKFGRISGALLRRLIKEGLPPFTAHKTKKMRWLCASVWRIRRGVSARLMAGRLREAGCQARARAQRAAARNQVEAVKVLAAKGLERSGRPALSVEDCRHQVAAKVHRVVACLRECFESCSESLPLNFGLWIAN
jgi:hypothetical protein